MSNNAFVKRTVKSENQSSLVGKLVDSYAGPWKFTVKFKGGSYELNHRNMDMVFKRHDVHMSPYPDEILPYLRVYGPEIQYGNTNSPMDWIII